MNTSRVCTAAYGTYCASCVPEMAQSTVMLEEHHEATVGGACELVNVTRGFPAAMRPLPLNSKSLTSVYVWTIAKVMELTRKGSVTETRQMIEGKAVIEKEESGTELVFLMDLSGVFMGPELILHPHKEENGGSGAETHEEPEEGESADGDRVSHLEEALADSKACNEQLEAEVSHLSGELASVKGRVDEMLKINCAQVVAFDETITEKDVEIER